MSSLIAKPFLDEGKVVGGGTVVAYFIIGVFVIIVVMAFMFQEHGVVKAGQGLLNSFTALLMSPVNAIAGVLQSIVLYIYNLATGFVNTVGKAVTGHPITHGVGGK